MPEKPTKASINSLIAPRKVNFESIGDFYVLDMTIGDGLKVLEKFPQFLRKDAIEGLKLYLSLVAYVDEECTASLSKAQLSKVTTEELCSHFTKQIEKDDFSWFNVYDLEESELETHQSLLADGSSEEHLYYILHNSIPLGKSKHLATLTGISDSVLKGFGSSVTDAFTKSFMASNQLTQQIDRLDKLTGGPVARMINDFHKADTVGSVFKRRELEPTPLPQLPVHPAHKTNEKLEGLNERIEEMNQLALSTSKVIGQLNETVLEFLLGFTKVAKGSTRTTTIMIAIAMVGLVISSGFSVASYFGSKSDTQNLNIMTDTANKQREALGNIGVALKSHTEINQAILNQLKALDKSNASLESILTQLKEANGHEKDLVEKINQLLLANRPTTNHPQ